MATKRSRVRVVTATTVLTWLCCSSLGSVSAFQPITLQTQPQRAAKVPLERQHPRTTSSTRLYDASTSPAITLEGVSCTHDGGDNWQLKDVSYVLQRGSKAALVGRNGCGKSTMLRILAENCCLAGTVDTGQSGVKYTGTITAPKDVRVSYVEQEPPFTGSVSVSDALLGVTGGNDADALQGKSVYAAVRRYRRAVETAETDPEQFAIASTEMDALSGWDVLTKAEEIATRLRVRHLQDSPLSKLSGGERKRVALAAALVQEPDVLLLDEPTNFLSLAGVQWLTDLLQEKKLTMLTVTHDRAFLKDVTTSILELDHGQVYEYPGNYQDYLQGKQERLGLMDQAVQSAKAKYRIELDWMRRQPQARASKSKARIDAFYKLQKSTKPRPQDVSLDLMQGDGASRRMGGKIVSMRNVSLKFGDRVMLNDFSYDFCKGDRICLVGSNGVGKTTFVRVLTGEYAADEGEVEVGDTVVVGVYDQLGIQLDDPTQTVLDFVVQRVQSRQGGAMTDGPIEARNLLREFEFPKERWNQRVSVLSGGERRRLQMLSVLSQRPNFLVMDEPSVDCDLDTLAALETYLQKFAGVLVIVSHDRAFADSVTDHLFVFEGEGEIKDFSGSLSEYASTMVEMENDSIPGGAVAKDDDDSGGDKKAAYKEDKDKRNEQRNTIRKAQKDIFKLEKSMEKLKEKAAAMQKEIDGSSEEGWSVLAKLTEDLGSINEKLEAQELEWMEVAEVLEEAEVEA